MKWYDVTYICSCRCLKIHIQCNIAVASISKHLLPLEEKKKLFMISTKFLWYSVAKSTLVKIITPDLDLSTVTMFLL